MPGRLLLESLPGSQWAQVHTGVCGLSAPGAEVPRRSELAQFSEGCRLLVETLGPGESPLPLGTEEDVLTTSHRSGKACASYSKAALRACLCRVFHLQGASSSAVSSPTGVFCFTPKVSAGSVQVRYVACSSEMSCGRSPAVPSPGTQATTLPPCSRF